MVLSFLGGLIIFKKLSSWNWLDRFIAASAPTAFIVLSGLILREIFENFFTVWNGKRLSATFALINGYQLYYGPDNGPVIGEIYGPVKTLIFLPVTLAHSPTVALISALFINVSFFFIPILWLHVGEHSQDMRKALIALSAFFCFGFFTFKSNSLGYSAFSTHADAPALGLSVIACAILYYRKHKDSIPPLLYSAVFAVLAVWTKQVAVPLLFALPTYVLLADGRRCFWRYVLCIFIAGVVISTFFLCLFEPHNLFFNMFTIPGHQPWQGDSKISALLKAGQELMKECLLPAVVVTFHILYQFLFPSGVPDKLPAWFGRNRWTMLLIVSLYMVPTSLLGRVKVGGAINTFSYTIYFLSAATTLVLAKSALYATSSNTKITKMPVKLLVAVLVTAMSCYHIYPAVYGAMKALRWLKVNPQQVAYDYDRNHPGEAYFPRYPLASLMAEGKLYHFSYGLFDRELAGFKVSDKHFRAEIPSNMQLVAFKGPKTMPYVMKYIPEFSRRIEVDELPGWIVYTRE
jgi:hypothetical protein